MARRLRETVEALATHVERVGVEEPARLAVLRSALHSMLGDSACRVDVRAEALRRRQLHRLRQRRGETRVDLRAEARPG
ncbi:MAG: hypothetical protein HY726_15895 [Candidatus Rokubacteria bacterium]|nr:hypothetical protein [Candidatus Rokubacteria bacterium]